MATDQLLKRNFSVVLLVLIGVAAFFEAQGIARVVGARLSPSASNLAASPSLSGVAFAAAADPSHTASADAILSRNAFDSVTGPLGAAAIDYAARPPGDLGTGDPMNAPACEGVKVIIVAASTDPDWSFAAFAAGAGGKSVLRRRGGNVGGKSVTFVGWDRVWLEGGGGLCQARMFDVAGPAQPTVTGPPAAALSGDLGDIAKGIRRNGPTEFTVDRGVVDRIIESQADLMAPFRIVPERENGKVVGIRLFGVRPDTVLGLLGMENGDRLETLNGFDLTSPEKALEAYARLRTADHLTLALKRGGRSVNLDYDVK